MAIGRADAWNSPLIPVAVTGRPVVWNLRADPIWASGHVAAQQAGHMNAVDLQPISFAARLNPRGRPHMVLSTSEHNVAGFALPGTTDSACPSYSRNFSVQFLNVPARVTRPIISAEATPFSSEVFAPSRSAFSVS
jgi:hypothetical protein